MFPSLFDFFEEEIRVFEADFGLSYYFPHIRNNKKWTGLKLSNCSLSSTFLLLWRGAGLIMP